jgi:HlyD family secretion protein
MSRRILLIGGAALVILAGVGVKLTLDAQEQPRTFPLERGRAANEIIARGHIEPLGRVIAVNGPPEGGSTVALVSKLLVDQGAKVEAGQVVAILNGFDVAKTDYEVADANLALAKLQYEQVQAGVGKPGDIAAQRNVVAARRAELARLEKDWTRTAELVRQNFSSVQNLDTRRAQLLQGREDVQQAENALKALTEVRDVDLRVSAGQVAVSEANVARAKALMERLQIRAPVAGTVLSIQARAGEAIQVDGILRLGDLSRLIAVAEVDQAQVGMVANGMSAAIEGPVLAQPVPAKVTRIAHEVFRQKRPSSDILTGRDAKIVEVELTPQTPLPAVVGGEVTVRFQLSAAK